MPIYKTRRQRRFEILQQKGFLRQEAVVLSTIPFGVPYMKALMDDREKRYKRAQKLEWDEGTYRNSIKSMYRGKGWARMDKTGRLLYDPYRLLKSYEIKYKSRHDQYESPGEKKRRDYSVFKAKFHEREARPSRKSYASRKGI